MAFSSAPSVAWAHLTTPVLRSRWEGPLVIEESTVAGRRGVGTITQCVTGHLATIEEVVDWQPYDHVGWRMTVPDVGPVAVTVDLDPAEAGTRVRLRWTVAEPRPDADAGTFSSIARDKRDGAGTARQDARQPVRARSQMGGPGDDPSFRLLSTLSGRHEDRTSSPIGGRRFLRYRPLLRALRLVAASDAQGQRLPRVCGVEDVEHLRLLMELRRLDLPLDDAARIASWCHSGHCADATSELPEPHRRAPTR